MRFGDPEAQVVLPMLDEDLSWLLGSAATGALPSRPARFRDEPHVGVVLAHGRLSGCGEDGPGRSPVSTRRPSVPGRAGVSRRRPAGATGELVTAGGRVLTVVGRGAGYREAIDVAYRAASHIRFDGMQFRTRHRPQGALTATRPHEVRRRHVRLPRQSGRFARHRRRPAVARCAVLRRPRRRTSSSSTPAR